MKGMDKEEFRRRFISNSGRIRSELKLEMTKFVPGHLLENFKFPEAVYLFVSGLSEPPKCDCGKDITRFYSFPKGYHDCCHSCSVVRGQKKAVQTNLIKYGTTNPLKNKDIQNKVKNTMVLRYGVEHNSQTKEFKEKIKTTSLNKYGVAHPSMRPESTKKRNETNLKRYGVIAPSKLPQFKEKVKKTNLSKYGTEWYFQSEDKKIKTIKTNLNKRGVAHHLQTKESKQKQKKTNLTRYGVEYISQNDSIQYAARASKKRNSYERRQQALVNTHEFLFTAEEYIANNTRYTKFNLRCVSCGTEYADYFEDGNIPLCPSCYPTTHQISNQEMELGDFIDNNCEFDVIRNDRTTLKDLELDIFIPSLRVALEFNGVYWHSTKFRDKKYHKRKTDLCAEQDIRLIHIFEDEWSAKRPIIESMLSNIIGQSKTKLYARKCCVAVISDAISREFLEINHLQGYAASTINLGLYFENDLVSLMAFGNPRFNTKYEWEMIRFASKLNTIVVGGASKLLEAFIRNHNPSSILSYQDRCRGDTDFYNKIGFELISRSEPEYFYSRTTGNERKHRLQMSKKSQERTMNKFNPELNEEENAYLNGWMKIWDCGQNVWVWKP